MALRAYGRCRLAAIPPPVGGECPKLRPQYRPLRGRRCGLALTLSSESQRGARRYTGARAGARLTRPLGLGGLIALDLAA